MRYFYRNRVLNPAFAAPPGYRSEKSAQSMAAHRKVTENAVSAEDRLRVERGDMEFWEYDRLGYIVAGSPARVTQRIRELCVDLRIGQLIGCLHMGNLPEDAAATRFLWPIPERGLSRRLPFIQAPTLVLHGAADGLIPTDYAEDLAARIPDARLQLLANAGHLPMFDVEDAFTLAVEEFLA